MSNERKVPRWISRMNHENKTEQAHKVTCNINTIMAKARHGQIIEQRPGGSYGDFSGEIDFHTAQNRIQQAYDEFMTLPATMRKRFNNDPGHLLEFLNNPENAAEAIELGIIARPVPEATPPEKAPETAPGEPKTAN